MILQTISMTIEFAANMALKSFLLFMNGRRVCFQIRNSAKSLTAQFAYAGR
jgi:hypothetical protein